MKSTSDTIFAIGMTVLVLVLFWILSPLMQEVPVASPNQIKAQK